MSVRDHKLTCFYTLLPSDLRLFSFVIGAAPPSSLPRGKNHSSSVVEMKESRAPKMDLGRGGGDDASNDYSTSDSSFFLPWSTQECGNWWEGEHLRGQLEHLGFQMASLTSPAIPLNRCPVIDDGYCLFRTLSLFEYGDEKRHDDIRKAIAIALEQHATQVNSLVFHSVEKMRIGLFESYMDYVSHLRRGEGELKKGGPVEIMAYSEMHNLRAEVYYRSDTKGAYHLFYSYGEISLKTVRLLYTGVHFDLLEAPTSNPSSPGVANDTGLATNQRNSATPDIHDDVSVIWSGM